MNKLCVIGDPVEHSKSPLIHTTMLQALGLNYVYLRQHVPRGETARWLAQARAEGYVGFNATMPHKEALVSLVDELDEHAKLYGSVNTVCIKNSKLYGYNTDGRGFLAALAQEGISVAGKRVLVLGAGGAAKAVVLALAQAGISHLRVCNRSPEKALALCKQGGPLLAPADLAPATLSALATTCDLLINCTSLGMEGTVGQYEDFSFLEQLPPHAALCDLIYAPAETALLHRGRVLGHPTVNGLGMLLWQAVFALEHFTDTKLDGAAMVALARAALAREP